MPRKLLRKPFGIQIQFLEVKICLYFIHVSIYEKFDLRHKIFMNKSIYVDSDNVVSYIFGGNKIKSFLKQK